MKMKMRLMLMLVMVIGVCGVARSQIHVHAPMLTGGRGDTVEIPIITEDVTGANVLAFQFGLGVDGNLLTILGIKTTATLTDQPDWTVMENILSDTIKVGAFGTQPLASSGTLVSIRCLISGDVGAVSWLRITGFVFNAGIPAASVANGSISIVTARDNASVFLPEHFSLFQNYPNPFNPSTTIQFTLPQKVSVTLNVYDVLAHQVAQLVNGEQEAGYHTVVLDGGTLASGVYYYRLRAGDFIGTKKLLLLR
jgi:hypothetical protein